MHTSTPIPLACLPFGGAGPSFYHAWSKLGFDGLSVYPVPLAGRERRIGDDPFTDLHLAADQLAAEIAKTTKGQPLALFGHCFMGSILAYEIGLRLNQQTPGTVLHLFVSASRTPAVNRKNNSTQLDDEQFLAMVKSTTGYQHPAFDIPEMRELLLPTLRADFQMDENYAPRGQQKLDAPITAIYASDDKLALKEEVAAWQEYTSQGFNLVPFDGQHMYLVEQAPALLNLISKTLSK